MFHLTLSCVLAPLLHSQSPSLLSAVPDQATAVARCANIGLLRDRMERNRWAQFMQTRTGKNLLLDFIGGAGNSDEFGKMAEIGSVLHGECVLFASETTTGFLTTPPADVATLKAAMQKWMPERSEEAMHSSQTMFGAQVDIMSWPGSGRRAGHVAAFVHHPQAFGLFSANDAESLRQEMGASLSKIGTDHRSRTVQRLETRRNQVGRPGLVEGYVDLSNPVFMMAGELTPGISVTERQVLGEGPVDLYASLDIQPGSGLEMRGHLNVPPGSLASRFADCLRPLPPTLAGSIPNDSIAFAGLGIDFARGYALTRKILEELEAKGTLTSLDQGLALGQATSGVDLEQAVVRQLTGPTALVVLDPGETTETLGMFGLPIFLTQGLANGLDFQEAFEELVPMAGEFIRLELDDVHGVDVYQIVDTGMGIDGGIAFLPSAFLIALNGDALLRAVAAGAGPPESGEPGPIPATLSGHPGVCGLSTVVMAPYWNRAMDGDEEAISIVTGAQITSTLRRTADGFELHLLAR